MNNTAIKEQEALIQQLKKEVELRNKWLSLIAHDFKGMFSNILWVLEAYKNGTITLDEFLSMLPEIRQSAQINQNTINDTFKWVNAELLASAPEMKEVNVFGLVSEVVISLGKSIKDKNISFFYSGNNNLVLNSNKVILQFIIKRIIDNAVKYSCVNGEVEIEMMFKSPSIHLFIKDKGIGMDSQKLSTIFTLDGGVFTGTQNEKGGGLSLVIVNSFVKMLGGEIEIYPNNDNIGTIVELRFCNL